MLKKGDSRPRGNYDRGIMSGHTIYLSHKQLDGSIVWNGMLTIQYSARSAAICTTVGLSYNVFFKLNDLHDSLRTAVPVT